MMAWKRVHMCVHLWRLQTRGSSFLNPTAFVGLLGFPLQAFIWDWPSTLGGHPIPHRLDFQWPLPHPFSNSVTTRLTTSNVSEKALDLKLRKLRIASWVSLTLTSLSAIWGRIRWLLRFPSRQKHWYIFSLHLLPQYSTCKLCNCYYGNMPTTIHFFLTYFIYPQELGIIFNVWGHHSVSNSWNSNPGQSGFMPAATILHTAPL